MYGKNIINQNINNSADPIVNNVPTLNFINNIKNINIRLESSKEEMANVIEILLEQLKNQIKIIEDLKNHLNYRNLNAYNEYDYSDNNYYNNNQYNNNYNDYYYNNYNSLSFQQHNKLMQKSSEKICELETTISIMEKERDEEQQKCCVCLTEIPDRANVNCGHLCVCEVCSYHLNDKCPICRTEGPFMKIIKS